VSVTGNQGSYWGAPTPFHKRWRAWFETTTTETGNRPASCFCTGSFLWRASLLALSILFRVGGGNNPGLFRLESPLRLSQSQTLLSRQPSAACSTRTEIHTGKEDEKCLVLPQEAAVINLNHAPSFWVPSQLKSTQNLPTNSAEEGEAHGQTIAHTCLDSFYLPFRQPDFGILLASSLDVKLLSSMCLTTFSVVQRTEPEREVALPS
jgi:hypothetical protein